MAEKLPSHGSCVFNHPRFSPAGGTGVVPLAVGTVASGVAAYLVIALGTRAVGEFFFAPVSILWSLWALSAAAISFPVQHWFISGSERYGEAAVRKQIPRIVAIVAGAVAALIIASFFVGDDVFSFRSRTFSAISCLLPFGSLIVGLERGILAHRRRFRDVAITIAGENLIRAIVTLGVLVFGSKSPLSATTIGWGIAAGFAVALIRADVFFPEGVHGGSRQPHTLESRRSLRLLGGFVGANVSAQLVLTSGPVLLALLNAPERQITQVFTILALLRVPYTGLTGATAAVTGPLASMIASGRTLAVRRLELRVGYVTVIAAVVAALAAPYVIPSIALWLFATNVTISYGSQASLAVGGMVALAGLFQMLVLLARNRPRQLASSWGVGLCVAAVCLITLPLDIVPRVCMAFLLAEVAAYSVMLMPTTMRGTSGKSNDRGAEGQVDAG